MKLNAFCKVLFCLAYISLGVNAQSFHLKVELTSNLVNSVNEIFTNFFSLRKITLSVLSAAKFENSFRISDLVDELMAKSLNQSKVVFRHEKLDNVGKIYDGKRKCGIFLLEDFKGFKKIQKKISSDVFKFNGFYLLILINGKIQEIEEILKCFWEVQIFNVNIIYEDPNGEVPVISFMPFNSMECGDPKPFIINKFKDGKFVNGIKYFYPKKMKNLNKCPIRVATSNVSQPFIIAQQLPNGSYSLSGRDIDLVNSLSEKMNFRLHFTFIGQEGYFFENGSSEGPLRELKDGRADLTVADLWLKGNRLKFFDSTVSYTSEQIALIVPPGREFKSFKKLILPMTALTWTLVVGCYLTGILVIFIIKRSSLRVQDFIFGANVRNPYLNIFIGFIGSTQHVLPKRNFARFLLMAFLMYSLVIRTLYQGSFYKLMQSGKHEREMQSIDQMAEADYQFYIFEYLLDLFQTTDEIRERFGMT